MITSEQKEWVPPQYRQAVRGCREWVQNRVAEEGLVLAINSGLETGQPSLIGWTVRTPEETGYIASVFWMDFDTIVGPSAKEELEKRFGWVLSNIEYAKRLQAQSKEAV